MSEFVPLRPVYDPVDMPAVVAVCHHLSNEKWAVYHYTKRELCLLLDLSDDGELCVHDDFINTLTEAIVMANVLWYGGACPEAVGMCQRASGSRKQRSGWLVAADAFEETQDPTMTDLACYIRRRLGWLARRAKK
jgi:hypothetical protein